METNKKELKNVENYEANVKRTYERATLPRNTTKPTASRAMYQARNGRETRNQKSRLEFKRQQFFSSFCKLKA